MQTIDARFVYSASDLNNYLECRHLTQLNRLVALKALECPPEKDEMTAFIARKVLEHVRRDLECLLELDGGVEVFEASGDNTIAGIREAESWTIRAMEQGVQHIYQATFF